MYLNYHLIYYCNILYYTPVSSNTHPYQHPPENNCRYHHQDIYILLNPPKKYDLDPPLINS